VTLAGALFVIVAAIAVCLGGMIAVSGLTTRRLWPPPEPDSWRSKVVWSLTIAGFAGLIALGIADRGSLHLDPRIGLPVGVVMVAGGLLLVGWGVRSLGIAATWGAEGELVACGPYRFSRNPQYLGEVVWMCGYAVLTGSLLTAVAAAAGSSLFLVLPLVEEPWLQERYGEAFGRYRAAVPRYVGRRSAPGAGAGDDEVDS
jgi:protein-S-isoprenylcysteine O-methyltransferase Ste14